MSFLWIGADERLNEGINVLIVPNVTMNMRVKCVSLFFEKAQGGKCRLTHSKQSFQTLK